MHTDTNTFFKNFALHKTRRLRYQNRVVSQNLVLLLSRIFYYHFERGRRMYPAAEKAKEYLQSGTYIRHNFLFFMVKNSPKKLKIICTGFSKSTVTTSKLDSEDSFSPNRNFSATRHGTDLISV